jgi:hypothetical protein
MSYYDVDEDSRSALPAHIARQDCERINRENRDTYSLAQQKAADEFKQLVDNAFFRRRTFLNFREKFIAVKVEAPKLEDKISSDYRAVMSFVDANDIRVKNGKASVIFHIKRK